MNNPPVDEVFDNEVLKNKLQQSNNPFTNRSLIRS